MRGITARIYRSLRPGEEQVESNPAAGRYTQVQEELSSRQNLDAESNIEWNLTRWGQEAGWAEHDSYGFRWSNAEIVHTAARVASVMDARLRPYLDGRYDLDVLEISPGAGRATVEFIRYAKSLTLVDLNAVPIEICRERLKYYPNDDVTFIVNDGRSLEEAAGREFDLVVSYNSLVHVHPDIVRGYMQQSLELLRPGGIMWFDHSGKGASEKGRRSAVTDELVAQWTEELGARLLDQTYLTSWDCLTVLEKPT